MQAVPVPVSSPCSAEVAYARPELATGAWMSQSMVGLSGLVTSSAKISRLDPPADATSTVRQVRTPLPAKSPKTSATAGAESTLARLVLSSGSWPGGMKDHSSVPLARPEGKVERLVTKTL